MAAAPGQLLPPPALPEVCAAPASLRQRVHGPATAAGASPSPWAPGREAERCASPAGKAASGPGRSRRAEAACAGHVSSTAGSPTHAHPKAEVSSRPASPITGHSPAPHLPEQRKGQKAARGPGSSPEVASLESGTSSSTLSGARHSELQQHDGATSSSRVPSGEPKKPLQALRGHLRPHGPKPLAAMLGRRRVWLAPAPGLAQRKLPAPGGQHQLLCPLPSSSSHFPSAF